MGEVDSVGQTAEARVRALPFVCGVAAWRFHAGAWFVLIVVVAGVVLTVMGAVEESPAILPSTTDKKFLKTLENWLGGQSEIMILVRYSGAAGNKSFEFFTSFAALRERLARLKAETSVTAFRKPQLPLRGRVDDEFIRNCLSLIPVGSEFLILETDPRRATRQWLFHHEAGESLDELQQALDELRGRLVAVGEYPQWLKDSPDVKPVLQAAPLLIWLSTPFHALCRNFKHQNS